MGRFTDSIITFRILKLLTTPFAETEAVPNPIVPTPVTLKSIVSPADINSSVNSLSVKIWHY